MTRIYFAATLFTVMASSLGFAEPASLSFAVATIKPTRPGYAGKSIGMPPNGDLTTRGMSLKDLIQLAYGLHPSLISGLSGWMESDRYDIVARPEPGKIPSEDQLKAMLRTLLVERFKLTFHRAPKETGVFVLVIAKGGSRMKERPLVDGGSPTSMSIQGARLPGRSVTMPMLAEALQTIVLDRPVIDRTDLKGKYDFDLAWTPEAGQFEGHGAGMPTDANAPSIFTALQEQLGLRLDSRKAAVESMVVDHAERPDDN